MTRNPLSTIGTNYIRQIQQQKIELALVKAQLEHAVRDRDVSREQARAHSEAMTIVVDALLGSLRPFGFSRKKFRTSMRKAALAIPSHGPEALQHAVLFDVANTVLERTASRPRPAIRVWL